MSGPIAERLVAAHAEVGRLTLVMQRMRRRWWQRGVEHERRRIIAFLRREAAVVPFHADPRDADAHARATLLRVAERLGRMEHTMSRTEDESDGPG